MEAHLPRSCWDQSEYPSHTQVALPGSICQGTATREFYQSFEVYAIANAGFKRVGVQAGPACTHPRFDSVADQTRRRFGGRQPLCAIGARPDRRDGEANGSQSAQCAFTTGAGTLHFDVERAHSMLMRIAAGIIGCDMSSVRGRFARSHEAHRARRDQQSHACALT